MADRSITSADSVFALSCTELALLGVVLEGYAADAAFAMENVDTAETIVGVDGKMSAGWVPRSYPQNITLQPDSPSRQVFDAIVAFQDVNRTVLRLNAVITLPGNQYSYTMARGVLKNYSPMPTAQRVLQPMTFAIEWERVLPIPIG